MAKSTHGLPVMFTSASMESHVRPRTCTVHALQTIKAEHDSESPVSIYEFTRENTHKYHTHESQVPMSMGFQGSKY
jgi:hypothetical protein